MTKAENRTFLSHLWAEIWCTKPSQQKKMKKKNCQRFFRFSLAVIAIENDDEGRKQNFSISPMGGVMVFQTLPAENLKFFGQRFFFCFSLAVIAIENDDEGRKQNFSISPMGGDMVYQTLPAEKNEKKNCQRFFSFKSGCHRYRKR